MTENDTPEFTKYGVECDPKKPVEKANEKTAGEGCGKCGGQHEDVKGAE